MKACGAIILAAGAARRWQQGPKALADWRGRTLIDHACKVARAAGCAPIHRVLGAHREVIEARPCPPAVRSVFNPRWADGLGSSIACGARAFAADPDAIDCTGLLVLLCDQPLVTAETLRALRAAHEESGSGLVFSDHGDGRLGPPAFFARAFWPGLAELTGDTGARHLARANPDALATVFAPEASEDIDTVEDHARLVSRPG